MTDKLTIGIIGGGMISQIAHLPFYQENHDVHVAAVAESRPSLVDYLRDVIDVQTVFPDHKDILNNEKIGTVVVIAPRQAVGPLVLEALNAGKNVLTEKPMAFTLEQAQRQVQAAKAHDVSYIVGFMKRYDAGIQAAKRCVDNLRVSGRLGRLQYARFYDFAKSYAHTPPSHKRPEESRTQRFETWPTSPDWLPERYREAYAGFINAASHDVNLIRYFFGDKWILRYADAPSTGALTAHFHYGDVPVSFEYAMSESGLWQQGAEFVFEKGRVGLEIPSPMDTLHVSRVVMDDNSDGYAQEILDVPVEWCFKSQAQAFVDHLTTGSPSLTSGEDCLRDLVMTEAIWQKIIE